MVEQQIADIWQSRLGVAQIGIHDNFFELGGHSLLAIQVASRLREIFDVDLAVNVIFEAPTVAGLAEQVERGRRAAHEHTHRIAEMLEMVEKLTEVEVRELLEGRPGPADGNQDHG